ncbi:hypothetical protein CJ178_28535 [Rhodococcus sp. ACPA4]|uniref:Integral membrane protein n=1 Tax=Rhodococcus globerulus TaxID=33008 RepID=A0ABU4BQ82_RHOGO|nr:MULTISPECIES: hypothetical protein [Rhodococcus]MCE4264700.1 hypothetical protein [Rhodococcus globerulus]MDV6266365.1 hypothetical protein [Rhodococcus globerulus]MDV8068925.1 hypothetical protein [Rhodococcus sp. IEGM 1366]PBC37964.1 hypothetical protein CJ178_28535 [Rhodococcus sp. ACPA4]RZL27016.1 MAG: hypothetical protein EOP31_00370 [Rhodococcus sp. (in: high G+C Gram-positive bacteria)]
MSFLYNIFVVIHLLGMAALVGSYFTVLKAPKITEVMVWGARVQFLSGLIIVGLGEGALDKNYIHAKIAVKLVLSLAIVALAEITRARQKKGQPNPNLVHVVGGLSVVTVFVAALWT